MLVSSITMSSLNRLSVYLPKLLLLILLMFVSLSGTAQSIAYKALLSAFYDPEFPVIKPSEVKVLSEFQVVDSREIKEYEVSHLKGALWVGYDTFDITRVAGLDKEKPVLVYCTVGARSQDIGEKLVANGFKKVYNLYGGIIQWSNEGLPLYQNDKPTSKVHTYSKNWGIWLNKGEKVY